VITASNMLSELDFAAYEGGQHDENDSAAGIGEVS
jgi:hypothetical protein